MKAILTRIGMISAIFLSTTLSAQAADTYTLDPSHTYVLWAYQSFWIFQSFW